MIAIFFIYGLGFFTLGILLTATVIPDALVRHRLTLRLLGTFGLIHSVNEWLVMATLIRPDLSLDPAISAASGLSFIFLFSAGIIATVAPTPERDRRWWLLPTVLILIWSVGWLLNVTGIMRTETLDKLVRWLLGAPGALLIGIAFLRSATVRGAVPATLTGRLPSFFAVSGIALVVYGLSTLPGAEGTFAPFTSFHAEAVSAWIGFPVQVIRAACAFVLAFSIVGALRQFAQIERAGLEQQVTERTAELADTSANLRIALDAAIQASQAKSQFLATMSHELRTPLNAILGFSEMIMVGLGSSSPGHGDKHRDYARDIHTSGTHLLSLVNDILDISAIEAGKRELHVRPIDLRPPLENALSSVDDIASKMAVEVRLHYALPDRPVLADPRAVQQIAINLLSNGIKYNRPGGRVDIFVRQDEDRAVVEVRDDGVGIEPDQVSWVFQPFNQSQQDPHLTSGGIGLGLSIVKALVDGQRGTIALQSTPGIGTSVSVSLRFSG